MKICPKCKIVKGANEFYRSSTTATGLSSWCKSCDREKAVNFKKKFPEKIKERQKKYYESHQWEDYIKGVKWRKANPEKALAIRQRYRQKNKLKILEYEKLNYNKIRARKRLNTAIKRGKIPSPKTFPCAKCGGKSDQYHHHMGYDKENWLNAIPVCIQCHNAFHGKISVNRHLA